MTALRTTRRLLLCIGFFLRQRKESVACAAAADFKIGDAFVVDLGGQQELDWIVAGGPAVLELDESDSVVEHFERGLVSSAVEQVAEDENRLAPAFGTEVFQRILGGGGAGIAT